ncbi:OsmC family protein [Clostridia bacterium]|nr:OsmC family protein [Clostridia bacterium]
MSVDYKTEWLGDMAFEMDIGGHKVRMDSSAEFGGEDSGPRPKPLILAGMTGCTGMDVVSILKKMKEPVDYFNMKVETELTTEHPYTYTKVHLIYRIGGKGLNHDNVNKACRLSREKYCGGIALVEKAVDFSYEVQIEDL